jgi:dTDP-glucose 4,6-dehydratase
LCPNTISPGYWEDFPEVALCVSLSHRPGMTHWILTGGCGFIGSNFVRLALTQRPDLTITNIDLLTYAGNRESLRDVEQSFGERYHFVQADIADSAAMQSVFDSCTQAPDAVINFAAESHVDRSITDPGSFIRTNIVGTANLLELARAKGTPRFLQVSTDEVYGSLGAEGLFTEQSPIQPNSPYSASKASADLLARAAFHTFGQNVVVTRCSNNYGPYQFPEKLIPLMIVNAMRDRKLPIYGDGKNVRDWIHVDDHCEAIMRVLDAGAAGEVYNIGSDNEWENIAIVKAILAAVGKPESLIEYVIDRPGHDRRYAIDSSRMAQELGWSATRKFTDGLQQTVDWFQANEAWWQPLLKD